MHVPAPVRTAESETSAARRRPLWQPEAVSFDVFLELFGSQQPEAAREAVAAVFGDLGAQGPDECDGYELPIADLQMTRGTSGEPEPYCERVTAPGLDGREEFTGCAFWLHAFSPGVAQTIFRISNAGGLTIIPVGDAGPLLPPSVDQVHLPEGLTEPRRVASGEELFATLSADFDEFGRFRASVTGTGAAHRPAPHRLGAAIRSLGRQMGPQGKTRRPNVEEIIIERRRPQQPQNPESGPGN
jgi:hypothetical protein